MLTFLTSAALHPSVLWMYIFLFSAPANSALYLSNGTSLPKFCTCKVGVDGQEILMKDYTVLRYGTFRKLGPLFDWKIIKFVRINIINILRKNKTTWAIMKVFCKFAFQDLSFQHHLWWLFLRGFVCYLLSIILKIQICQKVIYRIAEYSLWKDQSNIWTRSKKISNVFVDWSQINSLLLVTIPTKSYNDHSVPFWCCLLIGF